MKLLIVDAHAATRALIREYVSHLAAEIHECDNGRDAMYFCLTHIPDFMILDLRLGDPDGMAVLEFVRRVCPKTQVLMLASFDEPNLFDRVRRRGAARCFAKENLAELRDHLQLALKLKSDRKEFNAV